MPTSKPNTIPDALLSELLLRGHVRSYKKGEILITEGDAADALYVLVSGQLKVFTRDSKGRAVVYNILQSGEYFGEMFLDGGPRSASVKATMSSQCILVGEAQVRQFIKEYPDFAERLIKGLIARVRHTSNMIKSLVLNDVYERTVALLNQVAVQEGHRRVVPRRLTQQEIADRVGATREMINHVLSQLTKGGFITRDDQRRIVFTAALPTRW